MSLPWIAFYMGDYLKKTQSLSTLQHGAYLLLLMECWTKGHIPEPLSRNDAILATITKLSVRRFRRQVKPILAMYFNPDGTNKRATEEIEKAEKFHTAKSLAGRKGGLKSGLARTIARGKQRSKRQAKIEAELEQKSKHSSTNHKEYITSSFLTAARAEIPIVDNSSNGTTTAAAAKRPPRKEGKEGKEEIKPGPIGPADLARLRP